MFKRPTGMCAVCQDHRCATDTSAIWKGNDEDNLWKKEISDCSTDNLNSDVPCRMPNGWLVLLTDQKVFFELGISPGERDTFTSENKPCADLNLPPSSTPSPGMCAVCLEKVCANAVRRIYPAGGDKAVWPNANSRTEIQNCSMENLKPDAPCKMANGSLVQLAYNPLQFDGIDAYGVRRVFNSQISPCADLNLPPSSTPSPAPIHNTPTPAAPNNSVADNKGIAIAIAIASASAIGSVIGIGILILIFIVLIRKRNSRGQGQDRNHRHRNCRNWNLNPCPNGKAAETGLLNGKAANGNLNKVRREDDSVGTAGLLGHCNYCPV